MRRPRSGLLTNGKNAATCSRKIDKDVFWSWQFEWNLPKIYDDYFILHAWLVMCGVHAMVVVFCEPLTGNSRVIFGLEYTRDHTGAGIIATTDISMSLETRQFDEAINMLSRRAWRDNTPFDAGKLSGYIADALSELAKRQQDGTVGCEYSIRGRWVVFDWATAVQDRLATVNDLKEAMRYFLSRHPTYAIVCFREIVKGQKSANCQTFANCVWKTLTGHRPSLLWAPYAF